MDGDFQYGLVARAIFVALLWLTALLGFVAPEWLPWHLALLLFLGLGLKPLLIRTGLRRRWLQLMATRQQRVNRPHHERAARQVDRRRRDDKLRKARRSDPSLPPRW